MPGNTVSLVFAGDSTSLEKTFANVGGSAKKMGGDLDSAEGKARSFGGAMDKAGSAADGSEGKFMGAADLLDGLGGAFGLPTEGATGMMRAFGDLSGGFATLQPLIGTLGGMFSSLGMTLMAPPMGIILLIAGLAAALVLAYQHSETFRNIVKGAFDVVKGAAEAVANFITGLPQTFMNVAGSIKDALLWPYKTAFNLIARAWNDTVGHLSFSVPDWVPGLGGKGFSMPKLPEFHTGGVVPGTPGTEMVARLMAGETVTPAGAGAGTTVIVQVAGSVVTEAQLIDAVQAGLLRKQQRTPLGFN